MEYQTLEAKEKINNLRKERGWSMSKLAKEIGISATSVYNWYNEKNSNPSKESIEDACSAFGISVATFYSDVEVDKLTEQEMRLLEAFRKVSDKKKDTAIAMIVALTD